MLNTTQTSFLINKKLSEKLKVDISGEHTLADIFNSNEKSFNKEKGKIGFNKN